MAGLNEPVRRAADLMAANEQPYLEQLARGHRRLRFREPLEHEFRVFYRRYTLSHQRAALIGTALLCLASLPLTLWVVPTPAAAMGWYLTLVFGVMLPVLLTTLQVSLHDASGRITRALMLFDIFLAAGVLSVLRMVSERAGAEFPYGIEGMICMVIFLLSGQRFPVALGLVLLLGVQMLVTDLALGTPAAIVVERGFTLLANGVLAGTGGFIAEYVTRSNFLHRRVNDYRVNHDPLTGLLNRRGLDEHLPRLWRQAYRERRPLALMIADVDHFKAYNDTYGHLQGDQALRAITGVLRREAVRRSQDVAARLGGEEFATVWYDVSPAAARRLADSFRAAVEDRGGEHRTAPSGRLTVSCGCAAWVPETPNVYEELFEAADAALYEAKNGGRNRVVLRPAPGTEPTTPGAEPAADRPAKVTPLRRA